MNLDSPVLDMDFTTVPWVSSKMDTRIRNGLLRAGISTLGQLCDMTELPQGLGVISGQAIRDKLKSMKLIARV